MIQFILDNFDTIFRDEKSFETFDKMILDLAVRGKLVPQIEDEEPASKLLQKIKEEKERLIAEKVIKKEKPLPLITEDEKPFDIPDSWEWVRLGDILTKLTDGAHHTPTYIDTGIPFLSVKDISGGKIDFSKVKYISKEEHDILYKRCTPEKNDVLLTKVGTTGIAKVIDVEKEFSLFVSIALLKFNKNFIYSYFLENLINSPLVKNQSSENTKGVGNKNLVLKSIARFIIPLPPLKEQERIVEKVEKLQELSKKFKEIYNSNEKTRANLKKSILEEVEKSDTNNELLISLEKLFENFEKVIKTKEDVKDIRNLVLSLAVRGKLVPQIEDEEPASKLLQRIKKEKERLVAEKIIKKEKPLPTIAEDEKPFNIPDSWEWVRLGDVGTYKKGPFGSALTKSMFVIKGNNTIKVYEQKNAIQKDWQLGSYYITKKYFDEKMKSFEVFPGDIIVSCAGTIGETYVMPNEIEVGIINQALMKMSITNEIRTDYFLTFFDYVLKKSSNEYSKGSAIKNIPPFDIFKNLLLALPPLEEQERIVKRVDELMAACDTLESKIETGEKINQKLLASLVN